MTATTITTKKTSTRTRKAKAAPVTTESLQATVDAITEQAQQQLDQLINQQYQEATSPEAPAEVSNEIITLYPTRVGKAGDVYFTDSEAEMLAKALESEIGNTETRKLAPYVRKTWALPNNLTGGEAALIANVLLPVTAVGGRLMDELPSKEWIKTVRTMAGLMAKLRLYGVEGLGLSF
jgi:hypothetical protein